MFLLKIISILVQGNYVFAIIILINVHFKNYFSQKDMTEPSRKYKINDYLYQLNVKNYRKAIQTLPKILGVSLNTFHNYRNILRNETQDIPYEKVVMMEQLFEMEPGTLRTEPIEMSSLNEMFQSNFSHKSLE